MTNPDFRVLPEPVDLDEAVPEVDARPIQDPQGDRNQAMYDALGHTS
jgi:hypothetical protein